MRRISCGIMLMKWQRTQNNRIYLFASASKMVGILVLYSKGYKPHKTSFGTVMRKVVTKGNK